MTHRLQDAGARPPPIELGALAAMLAARIEELCRELLPNGYRQQQEWCVGSVEGEPGQSLRVHLGGGRAGVWCDFADPSQRGDALDLVAAVRFAGNKSQAVAWAKAWLGLGDAAALATGRRAPARAATQRAAAAAAETREREARADAEKRRRQAHAIWLNAQQELLGTPVERYLAGRGIDLRRLSYQPRALRYEPALYNRESDRRWPAMVAGVAGFSAEKGRFLGVHRTWLQRHPDGSVTKAPLKDPKMCLGAFKGGAIRIWRGERIDPRTGEILLNPPLARAKAPAPVLLTEGIEDALTIALVRPETRVLCAISVGNFGNLALPESVEEVTLALDNDAAGCAEAPAVQRAIARYQGEGRSVLLARPPPEFKDFSEWFDWLQKRAKEGVA